MGMKRRLGTKARQSGRFTPIGAEGAKLKGGKNQQGPNVHVNKYAKDSKAAQNLQRLETEDAKKRREEERRQQELRKQPKPWWMP